MCYGTFACGHDLGVICLPNQATNSILFSTDKVNNDHMFHLIPLYNQNFLIFQFFILLFPSDYVNISLLQAKSLPGDFEP